MYTTLSGDQRYFMSILREVGFLRPDQVVPLLNIFAPGKEAFHAGAMLNRLRYLGLLARSEDGLVCLPELRGRTPDGDVLLAVDILLALSPVQVFQVRVQPPYKLCFALQRAHQRVDVFAVMPVPVGHEARISQLLQVEPEQYVFLLSLESAEQHRQIKLARNHFFVLRQGGRLRFYKGGEAGT